MQLSDSGIQLLLAVQFNPTQLLVKAPIKFEERKGTNTEISSNPFQKLLQHRSSYVVDQLVYIMLHDVEPCVTN